MQFDWQHDSQRIQSLWFPCGRDPLTGKDFSHRRDWIVRREEQLAGLFAIAIE